MALFSTQTYAYASSNPVGWAIEKAKKLADQYESVSISSQAKLGNTLAEKLRHPIANAVTFSSTVPGYKNTADLADALKVLSLAGKKETVKSIKEMIDGNDISFSPDTNANAAKYTSRGIGSEEMYIYYKGQLARWILEEGVSKLDFTL